MKGEKKKKSVEKCKGADVKAIPENSIYLAVVCNVIHYNDYITKAFKFPKDILIEYLESTGLYCFKNKK